MTVAAVSLGAVVGICAASAALAGAIVGLFFRGAAEAWRSERDAAVDKAERLEQTVSSQDVRIHELEAKVKELEKRTDYEAYAERSGREHKEILEALREVSKGLHANTTAVEFLFKQLYPTAVQAPAVAADGS